MKRGNRNFFDKAGSRKNLEKSKRKRNIIIWFIIIALIIIAVVFLLRGMTGWAVNASGSSAKKVVRTCVDSDKDSQNADGLNFNVYGEVIYGQKKYKDKCLMNKWLYERYCQVTESGKIYSSLKAFKCSGRCKNGACETPDINCTDSDGGMNFGVKGFVTNRDETKEDKCKTGKEKETLILDENEEENFTLDDINHKLKVVGITEDKVKVSLNDGEAVELNKSLSLKINNLTILAKQVFFRKKSEKNFAIIEASVETISDKLLLEYTCDKHDSNKKGINEKTHVCPSGCEDGACLPPTCIDSDRGKNYFVKGKINITLKDSGSTSYEDYCVNSTHLMERYCQGKNISDFKLMHYCSKGCEDGACIETKTSKCTDSDKGKDYFVKGTAKDDSINLTDLCYQYSKTDSAKKDAIAEYYCDSTGRVQGEWYNCTYGCDNGACKKQSATPICVDSDGGKNFTIKGEVKVDDVSKGVDRCLAGNRTLKEYYCSGKYSFVYYEYCLKGCSDGVCLS